MSLFKLNRIMKIFKHRHHLILVENLTPILEEFSQFYKNFNK